MKKSAFLLVFIVSLLAGSPFAGAQESIDISGSTTVLPISQILAEAFMDLNPDVAITVSGGGSGIGITALVDGIATIAQSSRKIRQSEIDKATERGINIVKIEIAKDALSAVVHPSNPLEDISIDTLQKIYMGELTHWKELNGWDKEMVIISRDTASGTFEVWNEHVLRGKELTPIALRLPSNAGIRAEVTGNPHAIGYLGMGYVTEAVKALRVDGVDPVMENVLDGDYPIARGLFYYVAGEPEGALRRFIDFILSPEGQRIVAEEGFIPLQ
ncbi:MAG TPA: PstS family phosphate ABC transporter substrate-binding protein [Atribacteraceae bacterium]|nr:PstS family phosphate ABC transporter substrate-binding protein [Atribacteraceae bacterium]